MKGPRPAQTQIGITSASRVRKSYMTTWIPKQQNGVVGLLAIPSLFEDEAINDLHAC